MKRTTQAKTHKERNSFRFQQEMLILSILKRTKDVFQLNGTDESGFNYSLLDL